jgi:hypothetical protein
MKNVVELKGFTLLFKAFYRGEENHNSKNTF